MKNPAAVALGKLRRGVKERPSERKREAVRANLAKARAVRWVKEEPLEPHPRVFVDPSADPDVP